MDIEGSVILNADTLELGLVLESDKLDKKIFSGAKLMDMVFMQLT